MTSVKCVKAEFIQYHCNSIGDIARDITVGEGDWAHLQI